MKDKHIKRFSASSHDESYRQLFWQYHAYALAVVYRTLGGRVSSKDAEYCAVDVFADVIMHLDTCTAGNMLEYLRAVSC